MAQLPLVGANQGRVFGLTSIVAVDPRQMDDVLYLLRNQEQNIPKVLRRAINRTTAGIRSQMVKLGAEAMGVKQKIVRTRAWQNKVGRAFVGKVRAGAVGWPLSEFETKTVPIAGSHRKRVMMRINRRWAPVEGAFEATMPTGHTGIFLRKGRRRLPLKTARTRSLTVVLEEAGLTPELIAYAEDRLARELNDAAEWYEERAVKKGLVPE